MSSTAAMDIDFVSYETLRDSRSRSLMSLSLTSQPPEGSGDAVGDSYISIEGVIGSNFNDFILGRSDVDETLIGGIGDDILFGQGGQDTLIGGVGDDLLIGTRSAMSASREATVSTP